MGDQEQKVAIVTGGSRGIGAGVVAGYRQRGWAVVASALTMEPPDDPEVVVVDGDISEPATADRIVRQAVEHFGRVDTLVNDAGIYISKPFADYTAEDYRSIVGVNLTGFFLVTQRAVGEMLKRGSGHIVNITTTLVDFAMSDEPSVLVSLTKGGIAAATRSLAIEFRVAWHTGQRRLARCHSDTDARPRELRRGSDTAPARARGPRQRHRRRDPVPGVVTVHHRRDDSH